MLAPSRRASVTARRTSSETAANASALAPFAELIARGGSPAIADATSSETSDTATRPWEEPAAAEGRGAKANGKGAG